MTKKITVISALGLLCVAFIWGVAFVVVKNALDIIPPFCMLALRFTIAAILLAIIFIKKLLKIGLRELGEGAVLGVLLFLCYAFQTVGADYTTAGKSAFLTSVYVLFVPVVAIFVLRKKPDIFSLIGAFMTISGVALITLDFSAEVTVNVGDVLTVICGALFAAQMVFLSKYLKRTDPYVLTAIMFVVSAALSWISIPIFGETVSFSEFFQGDALFAVIFLGVLSSAVAFLAQSMCQKHVSATFATVLLAFEAPFGALSGAIFLGETLTPVMIIGCVLMFLSVIVCETKLSFLKKLRLFNGTDRMRRHSDESPEQSEGELDESKQKTTDDAPCE